MHIIALIAAIIIGVVLIRIKPHLAGWVAILWAALVLYVTIISRKPMEAATVILDPFRALKRYWRFRNEPGVWKYQYIEGIVINILMFMPLGYCLPSVLRKPYLWWVYGLCGLFGSIIIEIIQLWSQLGAFDIADVLNNTMGTVAGYYVYEHFIQPTSDC